MQKHGYGTSPSNDPRNYRGAGAGTSLGQRNLQPWNDSTDLSALHAQPPSGNFMSVKGKGFGKTSSGGQGWSESSPGSTLCKNPNYSARDPFERSSTAQDTFFGGQGQSSSTSGNTQRKNPDYAKRDPFEQEELNQTKPMARRPPTVICYICGREYGTASIGIHEKQCIVRWRRENEDLPPSMQRPEPVKPQISMQTGASTGGEKRSISGAKGGEYDLDAINDAAIASHQAQYVRCDKCDRTFLPDRLAIHAKSCRGFSRRKQT